MKHILIYLIIAAAIFGLLGVYLAKTDAPEQNQSIIAETPVAKETVLRVGVLMNHSDNQEKVDFRETLESELGPSAIVQTADSAGDADAQVRYLKKMLEDGCRYVAAEIFNHQKVDEMIGLAKSHEAVLLLYGHDLSRAQAAAYEDVYTIGISQSDTFSTIADVVASYWKTNEEELDEKNPDHKLSYVMVSREGFTDSDERTRLEEAAAEQGCQMELVRDTVTEYLNYNFAAELDRIFYDRAELILFADSADAEKAYKYYHDPSEYPRGVPPIYFGVLEADNSAYSLYQNNQVLFIIGNGGSVMGRMTAKIISACAEEEPLNYTSVGVTPTGEGRAFLCGDLLMRNLIEVPGRDE